MAKELTLQDVKEEYAQLSYYDMVSVDFEQYLKENYMQTYDINLTFIGYERR
jgi:hypothetical protein